MNFNVNRAVFSSASSSSSSQQLNNCLPSSSTIAEYNREYSLIYAQVGSFLKQCKESISRYMAFNNFGVGFDLGIVYKRVSALEIALQNNMDSANGMSEKVKIKKKHQASFQGILSKMDNVIKELLDFEVQFKKEYFGLQLKKSSVDEQMRGRMRSPTNFAKSSISSGCYSKSSSSRWRAPKCRQAQIRQNDKKEEQIRKQLNTKLQLNKLTLKKQCNNSQSPAQNIDKLASKMDSFIKDMQINKQRQEKVIQLFNLTRMKNLHQTKDTSLCQQPDFLIQINNPSYIQFPSRVKEDTYSTNAQYKQLSTPTPKQPTQSLIKGNYKPFSFIKQRRETPT